MSEKIASLYVDVGADVSDLQAGLNKVKTETSAAAAKLNGLQGAAGNATGAANGLGAGLGAGAGMLMKFGAAAMIANQVMNVAADAYEGLVVNTNDYNLAIRKTAINLGVTTMEASRMVQVMDDFGISQAESSKAMEMMVMRGFAPTVESLAELADEYVAITDPIKRADMMQEKLGRNWTVLSTALSQGGNALRNAAGGIEDGLIVTADAAAASEEYRKSIDVLEDSFAALKMQVGNGVIPVLNDFVNLLLGTDFKKLQADIAAEGQATIMASKSYEDYVAGLKAAADAQGLIIKNGALVRQTYGDEGVLLEEIVRANHMVSESEYIAAKYGDDMAEAKQQHMESAQKRQYELITAEQRQAEAAKQTSLQMQRLGLFMSGPIRKANDEYLKQTNDLQTALSEQASLIAELQKKPWMRKELKEAEQGYQTIVEQIQVVEQQHTDTGKQIMYNIAQQQLAQDGINQEEADFLMGMGEQLGLIDEQTAGLWDAFKFPVEAFQKGELSAAKTLEIMERLATDWLVTVNFQYNNMPNGMGGPMQGTPGVSYGVQQGPFMIGPGQNQTTTGGTTTAQGPLATGGAYSGGVPRLTGEGGPEIDVPAQNGYIISHAEAKMLLGGGRGDTYVINMGGVNLPPAHGGYNAERLIRDITRLGGNR